MDSDLTSFGMAPTGPAEAGRTGAASTGERSTGERSTGAGLAPSGRGGNEPSAPMTTVYTDGACLGNPGPGGWAWAVDGGAWASGADPATTNQRMEVHAVLAAVRALPGPLTVVSDSTYVVNCFRDRWWKGWQSRGWLNSARQPVANRDLWEPLVDLVNADPTRVSFRWVKGHSGNRMNDRVDLLATTAARSQRGSRSDG
ncbi:MAG: ribonuclease H family protein [Acidimicrobiales bacterium]